jgi:4-hydroxythreonine-4-phosphate dehydrogenase
MKKHITIVGNVAIDKADQLKALLAEEELREVCATSFATDINSAIDNCRNGKSQGVIVLDASPTLADNEGSIRLQINSGARMTSVMGNMSVGDAAVALNKDVITEKAKALWKMLKRDLDIENPRIAIMSLNPEIAANESSEELNIIAPCVSDLVNQGIQIFGPYPAATFFSDYDYTCYDAVLTMYDSQCQDEFHNASNNESVALHGNMDVPVIEASATTIVEAIFTILDITRNRSNYDTACSNPLEKLYHERREDGDKARFAVKKKGFNPAEHRREGAIKATIRDVEE